jgi:hypothetical protein
MKEKISHCSEVVVKKHTDIRGNKYESLSQLLYYLFYSCNTYRVNAPGGCNKKPSRVS